MFKGVYFVPRLSQRGLFKWVRPSIRAAAKYISRLTFVLMSGLFRYYGLNICFVRLKIGVVGLKKIEERSKG